MQIKSKAIQDQNKHARASATSRYVINHPSHEREREIILLRSIVMTHANKNYNEGLLGLIQEDLR